MIINRKYDKNLTKYILKRVNFNNVVIIKI